MSIFEVTRSDFSPIDELPPFFSGVYLLLDADGEILYVGQSGDVPSRVRTHRRQQKWRAAIDAVKAYPLGDPDDRLTLETLIFLRYRPPHNRTVKLSKRKDGSIFECQFARFDAKGSRRKR